MSALLQHCRIVNIPGTPGVNGSKGATGANGSNAWASLAADFTMPAQGASGTATLDQVAWLALDEPVWIESLGTLKVLTISGTSVELLNLQDGSGAYAWNAAPGTIAAATTRVTPTGFQGLDGNTPAGSAPDTASYILQAANVGLASAQSLGALTTGLLKNTVGAGVGVLSKALDGTDYLSPSTGLTTGAIGTTVQAKSATLDALIASSPSAYMLSLMPTANLAALLVALGAVQQRYGILGKLTALDLNTGGATQCTINTTKYIIRRIIVESASVNLTTATLGIFTSGAGTIAADQALSALSASSKWLDLTISSIGLTDILTGSYVNVTVGTPQGVPATANVWIEGENLA